MSRFFPFEVRLSGEVCWQSDNQKNPREDSGGQQKNSSIGDEIVEWSARNNRLNQGEKWWRVERNGSTMQADGTIADARTGHACPPAYFSLAQCSRQLLTPLFLPIHLVLILLMHTFQYPK